MRPFLLQLYGYTPLHMACLYDQTRVVVELLKKFKSESSAVNVKDKVSMGWSGIYETEFIILLCGL